MIEKSGTFPLGGRSVHRLGFGAMRITGDGIWGDPPDREEAKAVLRRVVELGIDLIDTADSYGPDVSEALLGEVLAPYPPNLVIATKGGLLRPGPNVWVPNGDPAHLRSACEGSLRRLKLERIELYQLHRVDPAIPLEESLGALVDLQSEGKIEHIGVSNFDVDELERGMKVAKIVSVQNRYNLVDRKSEPVLQWCAQRNIAFIPWKPLNLEGLDEGTLQAIARNHESTPRQIALAWLLQRSPVVLPIPGTGSVEHLEANVRAAAIRLSDEEMRTLDDIA